jgi:fucose permease
MITIRHGNAVPMQYILVGFVAGQVVGRLALAHPTSWVGERVALSAYCAIAIGFLAVMQFVDNVPANAVAVAFVGVFLG